MEQQLDEMGEGASMDKRGFESVVRRLLKQDLSQGTETFREALLARCLELLGPDDISDDDGVTEVILFDDDLDMLAAAGSIEDRLADGEYGEQRTTT